MTLKSDLELVRSVVDKTWRPSPYDATRQGVTFMEVQMKQSDEATLVQDRKRGFHKKPPTFSHRLSPAYGAKYQQSLQYKSGLVLDLYVLDSVSILVNKAGMMAAYRQHHVVKDTDPETIAAAINVANLLP